LTTYRIATAVLIALTIGRFSSFMVERNRLFSEILPAREFENRIPASTPSAFGVPKADISAQFERRIVSTN
jgi:hypothetical protein